MIERMEYDSAQASWLYTVLYFVRRLVDSEEPEAAMEELGRVMRDGQGPAYDALTTVLPSAPADGIRSGLIDGHRGGASATARSRWASPVVRGERRAADGHRG